MKRYHVKFICVNILSSSFQNHNYLDDWKYRQFGWTCTPPWFATSGQSSVWPVWSLEWDGTPSGIRSNRVVCCKRHQARSRDRLVPFSLYQLKNISLGQLKYCKFPVYLSQVVGGTWIGFYRNFVSAFINELKLEVWIFMNVEFRCGHNAHAHE